MIKFQRIVLAIMFFLLLSGCAEKNRQVNKLEDVGMDGENGAIIVQGNYYESGEEKSGMFLYNTETKKKTLLSKTSISFFSNMGNRMLVGIIDEDEFHGIGILNLNTDDVKYIYSFERLDEDLPTTYNKQMYGRVCADKEMNKFYFPYSKYLAMYDTETDMVEILAEHQYVGNNCFFDETHQEIYYTYRELMAYQIDTKRSRKVLDAHTADALVSVRGDLYYADRWEGKIFKHKEGETEEVVNLNMKIPYLDLSKDESKLLYFTAIDHFTGTYTPVVMQYDFETGKRQELYRPSPGEWVQQAVWDD